MKFVIIGSGIVGLSIAKVLIDRNICEASKIIVVDKYAIPSQGTSIRNSGVLHALLDLTGGAHKIVNEHTQYAASVAVVNIIYNSDTNRSLVVDLGGVTPLLGAIRLSSHNNIILQCMKSICNIVYCNIVQCIILLILLR